MSRQITLLRLLVVALATLFLFSTLAAAGKDDYDDDDYDDDDYHHPKHPDKDHDKDHDYDHDKDDYDHHRKIYAPKCTDPKYQWTYNSKHQNPCKIAAYLLSTCHGGSYTLPPLYKGQTYEGACKDCECNTVVYSLLAACEACQCGKWPYYKDYVKNCTKVQPPKCFPYPVPKGTKVPKWALLDVTADNNWDPAKAQACGSQPEACPGDKIA